MGVELESPEPAAIARRWGEILEHDAFRDGGDHEWTMPLDGGAIRFVLGTREGVAAYDLDAGDRAAVMAAARERGGARGDHAVEIGGTLLRLR